MKDNFLLPEKILPNLKHDLPAGLVVFLVALPLCLGIALASGAPLLSGIITGIIGGIVVGLLSGSHLAVSGPAAGLTIIVLNGIENFGFEVLLAAVVLSGIIQLIMGYAKAGIIGLYFPSSVIRGMLSAIGLLLIFTQIPVFLGLQPDSFEEINFFSMDVSNTFSDLSIAFSDVSYGAMITGFISLLIIIIWTYNLKKKYESLRSIPGALLAVIAAILIDNFLFSNISGWEIPTDLFVNLPLLEGPSDAFNKLFVFPDFSQMTSWGFWLLVIQLAVIASLETLLSVEAIDKIDPHKRRTPLNRELKAQGIGNILAGAIGGLPMTAVIVRSSANLEAGARTKMAAHYHGWLLILTLLFIPFLLNLIPLSALSAILLIVGYKLAQPSIFIKQYKYGKTQFVPFIVTIIAILLTDLLVGILIGLGAGVIFLLFENYNHTYFYKEKEIPETDGKKKIEIELAEHISFLNKARLQKTLEDVPKESILLVDGSKSKSIDHDALMILKDYQVTAKEKGIDLTFKNIKLPE